jgi:phosphoglycerol transferase MdoB-like AlkP superfamily enzyme
MDSDIGRKGMMPLELIDPVREHFSLEVAANPWTDSLTLLWFKHSRAWLTACFFLLPVLAALAALRFGKAGSRPPTLLGLALVAAWLFGSQLLFSHIISYRYLHPFPPLSLMFAAVLLERYQRRAR